MNQILVIDDEESVGYSFQRLLPAPDYQVTTALSAAEGLAMLQRQQFELIILDLRLPDASGLDVLQQIRTADPRAVVLVITAFGTTETAIEATLRGAFDYVLKPFEVPRIKAIIDDALQCNRLMRTEVILPPEQPAGPGGDRMIGQSPVMQEVYKLIGRVAPSNVNVLLLGDSGTGKELVARAIYQYSSRADRPFLAVNCAAIPETLLESELFGYEKGAFSGAARKRIGKFEQADGGTIFLDEIGDMTLATQAKVLRVLQEGNFERLGSEQTVAVDVRVIAATNKDLEKAIAGGTFREDLYYRLKVITLTLPPLRLRREDIPGMVQYFLDKHAAGMNKPRLSLTDAALAQLQQYHWPGNVRELENLIKRAMVLTKGNVITPELLESFLTTAATEANAPELPLPAILDADMEAYKGLLYDKVMSETERTLIAAVMQKTGGNQVQASKILGISRSMLRERIVKYRMG